MGASMDKMAQNMGTEMKKAQREMQKEMAEVQMQNMTRGQDRMMRLQLSFQLAMARERLYWMAGFGTFLTTGIVAGIRKGKVGHVAALPLTGFWTMFGYQWDMAWGSKMNRVNEMAKEIRNDQSYWFVPIMPPPEEYQRRGSDEQRPSS